MPKKISEAERMREMSINRMLLMLVGATAYAIFILYAGRFYNTIMILRYKTFEMWLYIAAGASAAAAAGYTVLYKIKKWTPLKRIFTPSISIAVSAVVVATAVLINVYKYEATKFLLVAVPVLCLLTLIKSAYKPDFFYAAVFSSAAVFGLWVVMKLLHDGGFKGALGLAACIAIIAGSIACAALTLLLLKSHGRLRFRGRTVRLLPAKSAYWMFFAAEAIAALSAAASLIFGVACAYYGIIALIVLAVSAGVYSGIKGMYVK